MTTTNTTTAAVSTIAKPKQFTFGVSESHKNLISELRQEFTRPAAVLNAPPVLMSEKEALECLYQVATDRRFQATGNFVPVLDEETGEQVLDMDGNPEVKAEIEDLLGTAWDKIKARDYVENTKAPSIDKMISSIRSYAAKLNLSEVAIAKMIETAQKDKERQDAMAH